MLGRLAKKYSLGIVTGRPRADAERFLAEQGVADLFSVSVCMEDAPSKPDPAPVRLALERLGASTAWMLGDTPDDLRAARLAGVLPIGVPASGDDQETMTAVLEAAGAARYVDDIRCSTRRAGSALLHMHEIRKRCTVVDLAWLLGILPGAVDDILDEWLVKH